MSIPSSCRRPTWQMVVTIGLCFLFLANTANAISDGDSLWQPPLELEETTSPKMLGRYRVISDMAGGAIVVWVFVTDPAPVNYSAIIKAARVESSGAGWGTVLWKTQITPKAMSSSPAIVSDGNGGVIVTWVDGRISSNNGYRVFAQRLDAQGKQAWTNDVQVSNSFSTSSSFPIHMKPVICTDNLGGAYIGWGSRIARVKANGQLDAPGVDGIEVIPAGSGLDLNFKLVSDGGGGPLPIFKPVTFEKPSTPEPSLSASVPQIAGWTTIPGGAYTVWRDGSGGLFAQRIGPGLAWGPNGVPLAKHSQIGDFEAVNDGKQNLIVGWWGSDAAPKRNQIRAERLDSGGSQSWNATTTGGIVVFDTASVSTVWQKNTSLVISSDGTGGLIGAWTDYRASMGDADLYAQRVDANGVVQWAPKGVLLPPYVKGQVAPGQQSSPRIVSDLEGGAIVTYDDKGAYSLDISATRVNGIGNLLFADWVHYDGSSQKDPGLNQKWPEIAFDATGPNPKGAIIVWKETEQGKQRLFVQRIQID